MPIYHEDGSVELKEDEVQQLVDDAFILASFAKIHATALHPKVQAAAARTWRLLPVEGADDDRDR